MGRHDVSQDQDSAERRRFTQRVLADLGAFQRMHEEELFETGARRIGAEQEMFLVDRHGRPASLSPEILERIDDPHFTTELGRFNLEANLDPQDFDAGSLGRMEAQLRELLAKVRAAAGEMDGEVFLTGILPSLDKTDLSMENMAPVPRYYALNEAMMRERGRDFTFRIEGRDQIVVTHDNVLLEACNTSFQVHFQVGAAEFASLYNLAQAVTAPVLAAATNSPLLFGRQLWRETRIALFEQSIDTRRTPSHLRHQSPRVSFGNRWVTDSAIEIFERDLARFPVVLTTESDEDPFAMLDRGEVPKLHALRLHNGTVYRWNRPCYGISSNGKPHLRIENRALPAGPSVVDEMANTAFWLGLMSGLSRRWDDIAQVMDFQAARENFIAAARQGLGAAMTWPGRGQIASPDLILEELLPAAREGLAESGIDADDADRYLDVIEERVRSSKTGSQWIVDSFDSLAGLPQAERLATLVRAGIERQQSDRPVHTWEPASDTEKPAGRPHHSTVGQLMTTDLFTVSEEEVIDLVASVMKWRHVRHIPVEDNDHRLVGLVTYRTLMRVLSDPVHRCEQLALPVREIMHREVETATPGTPTIEAMRRMRDKRIGCLPVVDPNHRLVGIITEHDLIELARPLLEDYLTGD